MFKKNLFAVLSLIAAFMLLFSAAPVYSYAAQTDDLAYIDASENALKAFPAAEGYGQYSLGGRGGQVYHVTNLDAEGPGSLTYGIEEVTGARTIVFDVGGVIDLSPLGRNIAMNGPQGSNVTIAGQTAPYPGITVKGKGIEISSAHDIIIRNIRIRIGDVLQDGEFCQDDPLKVTAGDNIIIDHCTLQWAIDMDFSLMGRNITFSNNLTGKNLTLNSTHNIGGHSYAGAVNQGTSKLSFIKNFIGDSTQRSPRLVDSEWIEAYNNLAFNCSNGFDIYNYEEKGKNVKYNVYNNFARKGAASTNRTTFRIGRGRQYSGGVMCYFKDNYTSGYKNASDFEPSVPTIQNVAETYRAATDYSAEQLIGVLNFGKSIEHSVADLSDITLNDWDRDPRSYDNNNETYPAGTITYMDYPFPAPRGNVIPVEGGGLDNTLVRYALDNEGKGEGMGATKPARDLYDSMIMAELKAGDTAQVNITQSEIEPFFEALEARIPGADYSAHRALIKDESAELGYLYSEPRNYKTERNWKSIQGAGPALKNSTASGTNGNKPINWDSHTDVNTKTNPGAADVYDEDYLTDFEIGDWWGEYCGAPGKVLEYTVRDLAGGSVRTTTDYNSVDPEKSEIIGAEPKYTEVKRTIADLIPADWVYERDLRHAAEEGYKTVAPFMLEYMQREYPYLSEYPNYDEYLAAKSENRLNDFEFANEYTSQPIKWDSMNDGIADWYKEYRGLDTSKNLAAEVDPKTGYTYLEEYISFMADDEPLKTDMSPAKAENFKVIKNKLGSRSAQISWNTNFRASCFVEYGTEPGNYTSILPADYKDAPDGMHTYHDVYIGALQPETTYYYKVTTTDEFGNTTYAEGEDMKFTTTPLPGGETVLPSKPVIGDVVPYFGQVKLNWSGNIDTDYGYEIYYDTVNHGQDYEAYANKITDLSFNTDEYTITGLKNGEKYYLLIAAQYPNGKTPSEVIEFTPSGVLYDLDFTTMTEEEKLEFMSEQFMYTLGGQISMQPDPDTKENVLTLLDETNSHGVNTNLRLPVTQEGVMTYEIRLKTLYQKQSDALNYMIYPDIRDAGKNVLPGVAEAKHNNWQINFYKDTYVRDDKNSQKSNIWDPAFSVYFDASSAPTGTHHVACDVGEGGTPEWVEGDRFDGTTETPALYFGELNTDNFKEIGTYVIGKTGAPKPGAYDTENDRLDFTALNSEDIDAGAFILPYSDDNNNMSTGYHKNFYNLQTPYGDAFFTDMNKTSHIMYAMWYYEKGSAKYMDVKIVVDSNTGKIELYIDGEFVYEGAFNEKINPPYNVGKIELKSRNDGYSWVNVERIKVYSNDDTSSPEEAAYPYEITECGYGSDGRLNINLKHSGGANDKAKLIVASYSGGAMTDYKMYDITGGDTSGVDYSKPYDDAVTKVFIWDFDTLRPLSKSVRVD